MNYDLAIIGAGPGGYIAAIRASQLGLKVVMFEAWPTLGGTCLNVGCIPSKTLLHASELYMQFLEEAASLNLDTPAFDLASQQQKKAAIVTGLSDAIVQLFKKHNIDVVTARAEVVGPNQVKADGKVYEAKNILLAAGSQPIGLPFLPFDEKKIISSTGALSLEKVPKSMIVVGGGVIGVEMASVYSRLGSDVTVVEMMPTICAGVDTQLAGMLLASLEKQKISFMLNVQVLAGRDLGNKGVELKIRQVDGRELDIQAEVVLVAIGRSPRSQDLGVAKLNIDTTPRGAVVVDKNFRTTIPTIYAIGDLINGPMLAHRASYEGAAVAEIIAGKQPKVEYIHIPNVIYTSPELATVGLSEDEARELKRPILIGKCAFRGNPRARTAEDTDGLVKVVADKKTERILGLHILSSYASEMIEVGVVALYKRMSLAELGDLPFAHPTYSEAIKEACLHALHRSYHL
ncbi:MAG: dihydrolipoyl dehydrogenase [Verrucomicrobia bacterium]|nr:dihydrolipoyl dehydrogenase [Verrucomicrobiota bacterium]